MKNILNGNNKISKPLNSNIFGGGVTSKALLAALLLGALPAAATDGETLALNPTNLGREAGSAVTNSSTLAEGDLLALEDTTLAFPDPMGDGAVSFTPVTEKDENTITQFQYNQTTGGFEPVFYRVDVKTEYGTGDTALNFGWEEGADGIPTFTQNPTAPIAPEIIYKYDSSAPVNEALEVTTDISDTPITGNFIGIDGTPALSIVDKGKVGDINANFINNSADDAIVGRKSATINSLTGDFVGNTSTHLIDNYNANIKIIRGNFIGNDADATIYNSYYSTGGDIDSISGNFTGNRGTVIYNKNGDIGSVSGNFIGNLGTIVINSSGGAAGGANIKGNIDSISGNFINNYGSVVQNGGELGSISGKFIGNGGYLASALGIIFNTGTIETISGDFINNNISSAIVASGLISNTGTIKNIINSSFINNSSEVTSGDGVALGGAILSTSELNIAADNGITIFTGNKTITNGIEESNAITLLGMAYKFDVEAGEQLGLPEEIINAGYAFINMNTQEYSLDNTASLNLKAENNGIIQFDDKITGGAMFEQDDVVISHDAEFAYKLNIAGDETGKVILNNDVVNAKINLEKTNLYLGKDDALNQSQSLSLDSGKLSMINGTAGTMHLPEFNLRGYVDMMVDVDLANKTMDRITADTYGEVTGKLNVAGINLTSDATSESTEILFADNALKNNVTYGGASELPDSGFQTTAFTPIYKYNVNYDPNRTDGGYFVFSGGPAGGADNFNPAVLSSTVASQAANQSALNEVFHYSYEHVDSFTKLPAFERYAKINANKYAMSTDFNDNMPSYAEQLYNKGVWFKPFTTFESLPLKNGPKVDAITYGSLVGFDTDFKELGNGWHSVFSGFAGYVGSSLNYSGVDSTMNGGLLGFTETFYKGNFWTAVSATAGASVGETHNMYGKEDYTSLLAGVGSKTGYNFEFKEGRFIIQPIMYLGYTFVNTFDYKNSAGVNIESDPLHTIQINPSVRFIANLKGGWQPYASVGMVWNLMNETKATANNVRLPEMSVKPYVEYGVGVQRNWADKFTAYLQAMIRNGGRNGVSLTGGFRFMLGSDDDNDSPKVKKEIKSL